MHCLVCGQCMKGLIADRTHVVLAKQASATKKKKSIAIKKMSER